MKTQFWTTLVANLINLLTSGSFSQFKGFFQQLFDAVIIDRPDPTILVVGNKRPGAFMAPGEAPDDVKKGLKELILDLVKQAFAGRPILLKIITAFLSSSILDGFIDKIWDSIFAAKMAAGEILPSATFIKAPAKGVVMAPTPLTCSADDLRECCAEVGMVDQLGNFNVNAPLSPPKEAPVTHVKSSSPEDAAAPKPVKAHGHK